MYSRSGEAIAHAAWAASLDRVLVTSSALLYPSPAWSHALLRWLVSPIVDHATRMEQHITGSACGWTVLRTTFLADGERACVCTVDGLPLRAPAVDRRAVARFIVDELARGAYRQQIVGLSGAPPGGPSTRRS